MADIPASPVDAAVPAVVTQKPPREVAAPGLLSVLAAKDMMIKWFCGEFAAANAIIDALCGHLIQVSNGDGSDYDALIAAIHRRRLNWIPLLQMQTYHSIVEVTEELKRAKAKMLEKVGEKTTEETELKICSEADKDKCLKKVTANEEEISGGAEAIDDDSPNSSVTDYGSREEEHRADVENTTTVCSNDEDQDCNPRTVSSIIKPTKRFRAKEDVRGHRVNVVKGLKLYEDAFSGDELSQLLHFVNELREAGRKQELSGETFVLFNKKTKETKRELIQLGVPLFGHAQDKDTVKIEPIPGMLENVIDRCVEWGVIPAYKRPQGCVISFFDKDEHSQPFQKPPHVEQPITTLVLSQSTMVFGHTLALHHDATFRGSLTLSLKQGSLLVMRGNSAEKARHVISASPNNRVTITFFKLKADSNTTVQLPPSPPPRPSLVTFCPPRSSPVLPLPPGIIPVPVAMPAPPPILKSLDMGMGTGVFLPWTAAPRKSGKHLPPRAQRLRLLSSSASS